MSVLGSEKGEPRSNHMTHEELVEKAAKWLQRKYPVVVTEMASQREEPDAIGFSRGFSIMVECKATRADFLADKKKRHEYQRRDMGDHKYYLTPSGLVRPEECPEDWGLMWATEKTVRIMVKAPRIEKKDYRSEQGLLLSCIRRIGKSAPKSVAVKFYTYETKRRATLGVAL